MGLNWSRWRQLVFRVLGSAMLLVGGWVRYLTIERAGRPLLATLALLTLALVAVIVFDVVFHAVRGRGQACRRCGLVRPLRTFRPAGACPNCGDW